jgi:hypothetical protein
MCELAVSSRIVYFYTQFTQQVHMVRSLRHELAMLQTDHKQVGYPLF